MERGALVRLPALLPARLCHAMGDALDRGHHRLGKLRRKLGADYERLDGGWPDKPKWMRRATYGRLLEELEAAEVAIGATFCDRAVRLLRRYGRPETAQALLSGVAHSA
jgi:hypothetical protein